MAEISIKLAKKIKSIRVIDIRNEENPSAIAISNIEQVKLIEELKAEKNLFKNASQTIQNIADKLKTFYEEILFEHSEKIASLSVEIARKILMQKIEDEDYKIESMIIEILKNAPTYQDLVIRLNPKDLADCQKIQQENSDSALSGVKLLADSTIGKAECVLESPKGVIKSLIDEHLEQIGKALKKAG